MTGTFSGPSLVSSPVIRQSPAVMSGLISGLPGMKRRCCRAVRRVFLLTALCCGFACYTWYALTCCAFSLRTDLVATSTPSTSDPRVLGEPVPQGVPATAERQQQGAAGGDYVVRAWLLRGIKERVEVSSEEYNKAAAVARDETRTANDSARADTNRGETSSSARLVRMDSGTMELKKKLPQALIIGVKKCGTRALLEFLKLHPDIRAAGPEMHFFDRYYDKGLDWYQQQMPVSLESQITMEKTPSYFITKDVPERIRNMSSEVRILVVVRDPVTRAISDYTQTVSKRQDTPSFEKLAFLNITTGLVDTSWSAIRIGVYARYLEWWLRFFPLKHIHFISGENLIRDPAGEMALVQDFLGIKRVISEKHFYFNVTKGFPCLKKSEGNGSPHCLGKTKGRTHPDIAPATIQRLHDFFRPFNLKFYQMVGRDFGWP